MINRHLAGCFYHDKPVPLFTDIDVMMAKAHMAYGYNMEPFGYTPSSQVRLVRTHGMHPAAAERFELMRIAGKAESMHVSPTHYLTVATSCPDRGRGRTLQS